MRINCGATLYSLNVACACNSMQKARRRVQKPGRPAEGGHKEAR
jgi:hypothetical protein